MSQPIPHDPDSEKIFLDGEWFVPVDRQGFLLGDSFEGALGFVLRLYKEGDDPANPEYFRAMKLPRLVADTMRENAYVVEMHDAEVKTVMGLQDGERARDGLLGLAPTGQNQLKDPVKRKLRDTLKDLKRYPVTLFRFEKNERVQISRVLVSVDVGSKKHEVTPTRSPLAGVELVGELVEIAYQTLRKEPDDPGVVVLSIPRRDEVATADRAGALGAWNQQASENGEPTAQVLSSTLQDTESSMHWFAFLPSVTFRWADTTLQRSISNDERGVWQVDQHLGLIDRLLQGLQSLHGCEKLHGDIRPANVMCISDPKEPGSYVLGDYGSFCFDRPRLGSKGGAGETIAGPRLSSDRVSSFYAPERRGGTENEAADCACVMDLAEVRPSASDDWGAFADYFLIRLGWRKHLSSNGRIRDRIEREMLACLGKDGNGKPRLLLDNNKKEEDKDKKGVRGPGLRSESESGLRLGDRIRLRDHMFIVTEAGYLGRDRILLCEKPSWRVLHDSLVIPFRDTKAGSASASKPELRPAEQVKQDPKTPAGKPKAETNTLGAGRSLINISAVTEFRSWSAATDLYGIGAVLLYSVFRASKQDTYDEAVQDLEFAEMLAAFESVSYFRTVWERLETLRSDMERAFDTKGALGILSRPRSEDEAKKGSSTKAGAAKLEKDQNSGLWAQAMVSVNNIIKTAPGARRLLLSVDGNLAEFCFVLHFCLSCIHRRSSLDGEHRERAKSAGFPFCEDRTERARAEGPTKLAAKRLRRMIEMRNTQFFLGFVAPLEEIQNYEPTDPLAKEYSEDQLRKRVTDAERSATDLKSQLSATELKTTELESQLAELKKSSDFALTGTRQRLDRSLTVFRGLVGELSALADSARGMRSDKKTVTVKKGLLVSEALEVIEIAPVERKVKDIEARVKDLTARVIGELDKAD